MHYNEIYGTMDVALPRMLRKVEMNGDELDSRAGRVKELTHVGITLEKPWQRELLVEGRKPNLAAQIAETMWVLAGRNDVEFLSHYLPRAADFSDDGEVWRGGYGPRLRAWPGRNFSNTHDQLAHVVELLKRDPSTRQAVMSIYDPAIDTAPGKDIPCNNWLNFSSRLGKLDLHVAIRSNDAMWGWSGINAFEWSALQEIVAGLVGVKTGSLHFSVTSFHLYDRHWAKARKIVEQNENMQRPRVDDSPRFDGSVVGSVEELDALIREWFRIEEMIRSGKECRGLINGFPEPMMRSWLRVIAWWWSGDVWNLEPLKGTRLARAAELAVQPPARDGEVAADPLDESEPVSDFLQHVMKLHDAKHAAYGDSWKKRGELFSIIPNIARKVDRLGNGETDDETQADTALDLMVYLAKYTTWIQGPDGASDTPDAANQLLVEVENRLSFTPWPSATVRASACRSIERELVMLFEQVLIPAVEKGDEHDRVMSVGAMLDEAYRLAATRWFDATKAKAEGTALGNPSLGEDKGVDDYRGADRD